MRIFTRYLCLALLGILLLTACETGNQPSQLKQQPTPGGKCSANGTIQVAADSHLPSAEGTWSMFRGDLTHSGSAISGGSTLSPAWTYCSGSAIFSTPAVLNGVIYIASTDNTLAALSIQHPQVLWRLRAEAPFYSSPTVQNNTLYIGTIGGTFYAIDISTGYVRWKVQVQPTGANIWSSPTVANGLVIFGVASTLSEHPKVPGQVIALDQKTGHQVWRAFTQPGGAPGSGVWSSPAVDITRHIVYAGTGDPDDGVQAFNLTNGHLLWHWRSVTRDISDTDVGAGPLLYTDRQGAPRVVVGGKNGTLYSLNSLNGHVIWQTYSGAQIYSSPSIENGIIYAIGSGSNSTVMALDAQTGKTLWRLSLASMIYSSPIIAGQTLYIPTGNGFGPGDGGVYVLSAASGRQLQHIDLHSAVSSSPTVLASWLFVGTHNGNLNAFVRS